MMSGSVRGGGRIDIIDESELLSPNGFSSLRFFFTLEKNTLEDR